MEIILGALAPPLAEQLAEFNLPQDDLLHLQRDADAMVRLAVRGLLSEREKTAVHRRFIKSIEEAVNDAIEKVLSQRSED